ncbi:MAG: MBL fold metallo-hydrolase [archaeon]
MIFKVTNNVWKLQLDTEATNIYLLEKEKIVIDTGYRSLKQIVVQFLGKVVPLDQIEKVLFTHLHFDHIGNFDLFPNAKFYASAQEIEDFKKDPAGAVFRKDMAEKFNVKLIPLPKKIGPLEVIPTPGHTRGSVSFWYPEEKVLFSGDTVFPGAIGQTIYATSVPEKMSESVMKLAEINQKFLCAGHD